MYEILENKNVGLQYNLFKKIHPGFKTFFDDFNEDSLAIMGKKTNVNDDIIILFMNSIWDDTLSIGIGNIDRQHKEILNCISELLFFMKQNKSKKVILKAFDDTEKFISRHFKEEEAIQKQYKYPKYKTIVKEHKNVLSELDKLKGLVENGSMSPLFVANTYQKMFNGYRRHILELDKEFGEFLLKSIRG